MAKKLIFPHAVKKGKWSFGIAIVNAGTSPDMVTVELHKDKSLVKKYPLTIPAGEYKTITPADTGEGVFFVSVTGCGDDIYGTFIRLWDGDPCSEVTAFEQVG